jgi:preprotein translocase subunit YajC
MSGLEGHIIIIITDMFNLVDIAMKDGVSVTLSIADIINIQKVV